AEPASCPARGFVPEAGLSRVPAAATFSPRPHRWNVRRLRFKPLEFEVIHNLDGSLSHAAYETTILGAEFETGDAFEVNLQHNDDVPPDSFTIFPGVVI